MITDWHKTVYRKKKRDTMNKDDWYKLREKCFKRDKYTCQRCEKVNGQGRGLSAHHITPRSEGGMDDIHNLITLCDSCHDYVEVNNLRSKVDIIGSYEENSVVGLSKPTLDTNEEGYHFKRPAWHKWVYGGGKKPQ